MTKGKSCDPDNEQGKPSQSGGEDERISLTDGLAQAQVSKAVLHAWERRFEVALSSRSQAGWRYFTPQQIARLKLLHDCVERGARISSIMSLSDEALVTFIEKADHRRTLAPLLEHVHAMKEVEADAEIRRLLDEQGTDAFLARTLPTLMQEVGGRWKAGELPVRAEHMVSHVVNRLLLSVDDAPTVSKRNVKAIVGTLPDEQHELGALSLTIILRRLGVDATYLGGALPLEEIAAMAQAKSAGLVAISCTTGQGRRLISQLSALRELLEPERRLWAGGSALAHVENVPGVSILRDINDIPAALNLI